MLWDSHRVLHGDAPHTPTFRLEDHSYGPEPGACDFVFVSDGLRDRLLGLEVDGVTRASDHQPVWCASADVRPVPGSYGYA